VRHWGRAVASLGCVVSLARLAAAAPPNDECAGATVIASVPSTIAEDVTGATVAPADPDLDCPGGGAGNPGVWFAYTAVAPIAVQIDTFGSDYDTQLLVHGGACGAETGPLDCNEDDYDFDNFDGTSRVIVTLAAGETALIEVRSWGGGTSLRLNVTESRVFRVTPFAEYRNQRPAIARRDDEFLVVWEAAGGGATARRYDASGVALGPPLGVGASPTDLPDVAATDDGFVAMWWSSGSGVVGRLLDATGAPVGSEFSVTPDGEYPAAVAAQPTGDFMVVWPKNNFNGVGARLYDPAGIPLGPEFDVSTALNDYVRVCDVAVDGLGNFIVTWDSEEDGDPADREIAARRFDSTGTPLGPVFLVNTYTSGSQRYPAVTAADDGAFVVAWAENTDGDCHYCIDAQRFDASGNPLGSAIRVGDEDTGTPGSTEGPPIGLSSDAAGNFVVVWPGAEFEVVARRMAPDGVLLGPGPFAVSHLRDGYQYHPDVAAAPNGDFVVVWDWSPYGSKYDVLGRHVTLVESGICTAAARDATECRQVLVPGKSKLTLRDRTPDTADNLSWKWVRGEAASLAELGDPIAEHAYAFCLYDASGLVMEQGVGPGGTCGTKPCWTSLGPDGFRYVDKQGVRGPVRKLVLKAGDDGEAKVVAKMKGEGLAMPALPLVVPLRAQIQATTGECWDVEYTGPGITQNTGTDVKAVGP
jgi:hypothetical protein